MSLFLLLHLSLHLSPLPLLLNLHLNITGHIIISTRHATLLILYKELIQVILHPKRQFHAPTPSLTHTLEMTTPTTFYTSLILLPTRLSISTSFTLPLTTAASSHCSYLPHLHTPCLSMANLSTGRALDHILLLALTSFMPNLIALKTQFSITFKTVMGVLPTQDAVQA